MHDRLRPLALALIIIAAPAAAQEYVIDTRGGHASINFKFKHLGYSWLTGHFKQFDGRFFYDPANVGATNISVNIDPASIDSNHAERDKHIKSDDYLDVAKYPKAGFVSTRVESTGKNTAKVHGKLTLHGVTKEITFDAALTGKGPDPWGGNRAGFEASYVINTEDFGMAFPPTNQIEMDLFIEGVYR